jgi:Glycosyl hydrolase family 10
MYTHIIYIYIQRRVPTPHSIARNIQRYAALGLTVNISEMDVRTANLPNSSIAGKDAIAEMIYHDTLAAALSEPAFTGATFWGFTDKQVLHIYTHLHDYILQVPSTNMYSVIYRYIYTYHQMFLNCLFLFFVHAQTSAAVTLTQVCSCCQW